VRTMKKTSVGKNQRIQFGELRPEYRFDYKKARPNRFAVGTSEERSVVVLDPDVSAVFKTPESVNKALRAIISVMPGRKPKVIRESSQK
jgi:hypothetical protein